ncbi:MAG TPA: sulfur carrier protein ThiS [Bacillota bacterium]|nr:sulfur carrier protein ThiS [Bacillota bacterium]
MIKVNGKVSHWESGMTVERLIQLKRFVYPRKIVRINEHLISEEEYASTVIHDEDDVKVIHLMAGG